MEKLKSTFIVAILIGLSSHHAIAAVTKINLNRLTQTGQCIRCNLQGVNLMHFQPSSNDPKQNPFAKMSTKGASECWLVLNLEGANLTGANLSRSNITTCIRGYITPLSGANLANANFSNANLSYSKFFGVNMKYANFSHSNLENTQFFMADLSHCLLEKANLKDAKSMPDAMHGWGSNFQNADFTGANLTNADLYGNFQKANFSNADLTNAKISTSIDTSQNTTITNPADYWQGVNFTHANLQGATFKVLDSKNAIDFSKAKLCHTIMPNGTVNNRDCSN